MTRDVLESHVGDFLAFVDALRPPKGDPAPDVADGTSGPWPMQTSEDGWVWLAHDADAPHNYEQLGSGFYWNPD